IRPGRNRVGRGHDDVRSRGQAEHAVAAAIVGDPLPAGPRRDHTAVLRSHLHRADANALERLPGAIDNRARDPPAGRHRELEGRYKATSDLDSLSAWIRGEVG